ncbi:MAG: cysteine hydrolase [Bacteroidetes bacterium]|nr:MAG: cysteine hydrolase [Bacteroidota bacterium]
MRALLVIDLQRWFLEVGSAEKKSRVSVLLQKTNELIRHFEAQGWPIFKIQTVHKADKSTWNIWALDHDVGRLIEGTSEAEYSPEVYVARHEEVVTKTRLSAFLRTGLEEKFIALSCQEVVICGYSRDNCVGQTAIDAYEHDFRVILLAGEAMLGTKPEYGQLMLASLQRRFGMIPVSNQAIMGTAPGWLKAQTGNIRGVSQTHRKKKAPALQ